MELFFRSQFWVFAVVAAGITFFGAHNPAWHDTALWFLGMTGYAIGKSSADE